MPKNCTQCEFWSEDNSLHECPECGQSLQFTMFGPDGTPPEQTECEQPETDWHKPDVMTFEVMEQPASFRMGQIGVGIGFYFAASFGGGFLMGFLIGSSVNEPADLPRAGLALLFASFGIYVLSAVLAGMIASAWSVNWVPQGIGVGLGVFAIPIIRALIWVPEAWPVFLIIVSVTTGFTVLGALLGHLLIPPMRYPVH
jgi:MFS family permease